MKKTVMSKVMGVAMSTIMAAAMLAGCRQRQAQQKSEEFQRRQYRNQLQVHRAMIMEQ